MTGVVDVMRAASEDLRSGMAIAWPACRSPHCGKGEEPDLS